MLSWPSCQVESVSWKQLISNYCSIFSVLVLVVWSSTSGNDSIAVILPYINKHWNPTISISMPFFNIFFYLLDWVNLNKSIIRFIKAFQLPRQSRRTVKPLLLRRTFSRAPISIFILNGRKDHGGRFEWTKIIKMEYHSIWHDLLLFNRFTCQHLASVLSGEILR